MRGASKRFFLKVEKSVYKCLKVENGHVGASVVPAGTCCITAPAQPHASDALVYTGQPLSSDTKVEQVPAGTTDAPRARAHFRLLNTFKHFINIYIRQFV